MKALGVANFLQKKFKLLGIDGRWKNTLGDLPYGFMMIVIGEPGQGKTEFLIQMAKEFTKYGKVDWWSYEQGHGKDLQDAVRRNNMSDVAGKFRVVDPLHEPMKKTDGTQMTRFEELMHEMGKRNSADFWFIDSLDYTRFTIDDYRQLKETHGDRKSIIFISHAKGKKPASAVGVKIDYDGVVSLRVHRFVAEVMKNRFGGNEPFVIWEERARQVNPLFFAKQAKQIKVKTKRIKKPRTKK